MSIYNREKNYIQLLTKQNLTVKQLSEQLTISEPTVRRDILAMKKRGIVECKRGTVLLMTNSPDSRIPMNIRDYENPEKKIIIAQLAVQYIQDGDCIMMDASTTVYAIVPFLNQFKNLFVITNGSRTAIALASMGIKTICTGGEITHESFSYIGPDAEALLRKYNANISFFSSRGLNERGVASDNSIFENNIRKIMIQNSTRQYLLCDSSKFNKTYLNTLCTNTEITEIISDKPLPF